MNHILLMMFENYSVRVQCFCKMCISSQIHEFHALVDCVTLPWLIKCLSFRNLLHSFNRKLVILLID